MDQVILLLLLLEYLFKASKCLECDQVKKPPRAVWLEWTASPEGEDPDHYLVTYQRADTGSVKNVRNVSKVGEKSVSTTMLLEENKKYDVTIESLKNGRILSVKSFQTRAISGDDIKTFVTTTTVSFNWSATAKEFSASVSFSDTSKIIQPPHGFFVWTNLTPATVYTFKFIFDQWHLQFIKVSQSLDVVAETGTCSQGWVAFQSSCYQLSKESKPWKVAQRICEASSQGAHLLDIGSEEEHGFVLSYLQIRRQIILLWTGLNDLKEEGQLLWTDGSPYLLQADVSTLAMIPGDETDCYALLRDPTAPGYFFTGFFCYIQLPYICEYELPLVPASFTFNVSDVETTAAAFTWSNTELWLKSGFALTIKYYSDQHKPTLMNLPVNATQTRIAQLSPGLCYNVLLAARNPEGAQTVLTPMLKVETRPLHSQKLEATYVSSTEIHLQWKPPPHSPTAAFHHHLINILDAETNLCEQLPVEKSKTSIVIGNVKPYHQYRVYLQNVAEKGTLSCHEEPVLITTAVSPPTALYVQPENIQEESVILHWKLPQETQESYIQVKPKAAIGETKKFLLNNTEEFKVDLLIPGMLYEIGVASVNNGNMSELKTIQCTLKPKPVQIVVPYELYSNAVVLFVGMPDVGVFDGVYVTSKGGPNVTFLLQSDGKITVENLTAGTEYEFLVATKSGKMLSSFYHVSGVKTCLAAPANVWEGSVTDTSIQVAWERAEGDFQQYEVTCANCAGAFRVQKVKQESAVFSHLTPGKLYSFTIRTEKEGFRDSAFVTKEIVTVPSAVKYLNYSRDSESITVTWPPAQNMFDGYVIAIKSKVFNEEKMLPSGIRMHTFGSLLPGTDFSVSLVTTNGLKRSRPTTLRISTYPDPPTELQVFGQEENTLYFSWKPPRGGFDMFQLSYGLVNNEKLLTRTVQDNRAVVQDLASGTEYFFQLRTVRGLDSSVAVEKKVITKPAGICGLALKMVNTSSATVVWNPTNTNFTSYKATLSNTTFVKHFKITGELNNFSLADLTAGGRYNFTLQRLRGNIGGASGFLGIITEPAKPDGLQFFNVSSHSFSLYWRLPYGHVDRFHVDHAPNHGSVVILDLGVREYQADFSSTVPGTTYNVTVSAVSSSVHSSPASRTVTTNVTNPGPPMFLAGERVGSAGILLSWNAPLHPNGRILSYIVKHREVCPWMQMAYTQVAAKPDSLEVLLTSLNPGTTYEIMVAAENSAGVGVFSDPFLFQTAESAPGKVVNLTVEALNSSAVNLIWFLPRQPNGKITSFKIGVKHARSGIVVKDVLVKVEDLLSGRLPECNDNSESFLWSTTTPSSTFGKSTVPSQATVTMSPEAPSQMSSVWNEPISFVITNLRPYTTYLFEVSAVTTEAGYIDSAIVRTPESVPEDPPQNFAKSNITAKSFSVMWEPPTIVTGKFSYRVELYGPSGHILENSTKDQKFLFSNLVPFTTYDVYVSAETSAGVGPKSNLTVFTPSDAPSSPPESLSVKQLLGVTVKLSWKPPLEPNGIILYYTVYIWNEMSQRSVNVTGTSLQLTDLEYNSDYSAYLTASTRCGDGNITSDTITFRTSEGAPSDPPKDVVYSNLTSTSIMLFWTPPQKPNGNILYYSVYFKNSSGLFIQNFTSSDTKSNVSMSHSAVLDDLAKYSHYNMWLTASTAFGDGNETSGMIDVYTDQDIPDGCVENLVYQNISSSSVNVSWLPPSQPNGLVFFHVSLSLLQLGTNKMMKSFLTYTTSIVLDHLEKYTDYILKITPATEKGASELHALSLHIRTDEDVPESAPIIRTFSNLSTTSVMLSWDPPAKPCGIIISYDLNLFGPERNNSFSTTNNFIILEDLLPFTLYSIYAAARTIKGLGPFAMLEFYTDESVPLAPPQNLTITSYTADSVCLKWDPSPQPNGVIVRYNFKIYQNNTEKIFYQNISGSNHEANLVGLEPFSPYLISISAFTKLGNGNQFSNAVQFTTMESVPEAVQNVQCIATSWQSILVQWDPPASSNGIITRYTITVGGNSTSLSPHDTVQTFRNLVSNMTYQFKVRAATSAGDGEEQICNASTLLEKVPSAPRDIVFSNVQSTSVTLNWKPPKSILGYFRNYKITTQLQSVRCSHWEAKECIEYEMHQYLHDNVGDEWIEETVSGLKKYRWYRFAVAASTSVGYGSSSPWISTQTLPGSPEGPPENVIVLATSPHSINISWSEPVIITGPTCYLIDIASVDNDNYKAQFLKTTDEGKALEVSDLKAFTRYSVVIIAFTGDVNAALLEGKASSPVIVSTFEAVPEDPPNNITFQKIPDEVTKFQVTFVPPSEPNGNIQVYQAMVYNEDDPAAIQIHNLSVIDKTDQSVTAMIEGLKGGNTYNVSVYAINGAGAGPKIQLKITMDIKEPPRPKKKPAPVYDTNGALLVTATTITIRMPICYYSDDHGPINKIQVLVVEAEAQHDGNVTKWHDAYFNRPRPYFTNEGFPNPPCVEGKEDLSDKDEIYVIGADTTCMVPGSQDKICNGPLKPRKQYLFKFRATNVKGQFTDSDYSDPVKTLGEGPPGRSVEVILAVTLCVLSVVLLVAAVYAFARIRQKQKEGGTYSPRDAEIIDTKFKLDQLITVADLELKDERFTRYSSLFFRRKEIFVIQLLSYRKSIKPISKKSFLQHVEELCTNNNLKFQEEFSELPKFLEDLASTDADLPWNRSKNRFPNIKPYNNNRVKLMPDTGIPGSDYINASYVSGYLCPNEFIATQGPLPGTVGDFWRMVWETRAKTLVMLTQCFEKGRIRCHQYWPEDNKPVTVFGDIVITKLMEEIQIDWTIRDLKIERHGDCMMVRQCNFTSWPEHGVPETTAPIIHFVKLIRASRAHDNTPMVVHCSAGVGRTGVYIALDHLTQHVNDHDFVDIYGLVAELRSERMCMVQNLAQYIFLHQCVLDLLASRGSSQPICFVNYSALQKMDSLDAMEGDVELEWEETTM
ncbi:phosphatidylinositol phosphatase PTPRQ [Indicator indicator]|uniref:phosphatidylinositol phosphatase PTPRQ n=1 Tax=Indicator indicator TaxID=1002788 RepID=UPI0023DEC336|nr:phosphatidylinositol phosphatase PTPRQ [Indicator indicator]